MRGSTTISLLHRRITSASLRPTYTGYITRTMSSSAPSSIAAEPALVLNQQNNLLVVELNRPKALNALTLEMCGDIKELLLTRINCAGSKVGAFIVKGRGGKAFCAGGDVKAIWNELYQNSNSIELTAETVGSGKPGFMHNDFFRQEYIMNYLLGTSSAPQVSFWDGIVMGGGVGVSIFGEFRVATEKSLFAMPETAIGLFPDVGGSAWLPHLPEGYGNYIGMSGVRLHAADLVHAGIATHFISSDKLAAVESEMISKVPLDPVESRKVLKNILDEFQGQSAKPDSSKSVILNNKENIKRCFGESNTSVEAIFESLTALSAEGNAWATQTLQTLKKHSPTSLKLTFNQLRRGKELDLQGCLKMEFRLMMGCMRGEDFKEGIRAVLVDKDNAPKWQPAEVQQVTVEKIEKYFRNLGEYELNVF